MIEMISKKLYWALISGEPFTLKNKAALRQMIDLYVLRYGVQSLIIGLKERWWIFVKDGHWCVSAKRSTQDDFVILQ